MPIAALITHTHPETVASAVVAAGAVAASEGWDLLTSSAAAVPATPGIEIVDQLPERPNLCLVLGGDGTILYALRQYAQTGVPVFGINHGTMGFLSAAPRSDLKSGLQRAFAGEFEELDLPGLSVSLPGRETRIAINDLTLSRPPRGRIAELYYRIADEEVGNVRCDGLVVATPTGSTGYNLANNGPILAWGVQGYVVSYISPHTLTSRPLVIAPTETITVGNAAGREPVEIEIDGQHIGDLNSGVELEVDFVSTACCLAQTPGQSFYQRISEKFGHLAH